MNAYFGMTKNIEKYKMQLAERQRKNILIEMQFLAQKMFVDFECEINQQQME